MAYAGTIIQTVGSRITQSRCSPGSQASGGVTGLSQCLFTALPAPLPVCALLLGTLVIVVGSQESSCPLPRLRMPAQANGKGTVQQSRAECREALQARSARPCGSRAWKELGVNIDTRLYMK